MMVRNPLLRKAKESGFSSIEEYVEANMHYLSKEKQKLFEKLCCPKKYESCENGEGQYIV